MVAVVVVAIVAAAGGDFWGGGGDGGGSSVGFSAGSLFFRRVGGSDWTTGATPVSFALARVSMPISKKKSRKEKQFL